MSLFLGWVRGSQGPRAKNIIWERGEGWWVYSRIMGTKGAYSVEQKIRERQKKEERRQPKTVSSKKKRGDRKQTPLISQIFCQTISLSINQSIIQSRLRVEEPQPQGRRMMNQDAEASSSTTTSHYSSSSSILSNYPLLAALLSFILAQTIKVFTSWYFFLSSDLLLFCFFVHFLNMIRSWFLFSFFIFYLVRGEICQDFSLCVEAPYRAIFLF